MLRSFTFVMAALATGCASIHAGTDRLSLDHHIIAMAQASAARTDTPAAGDAMDDEPSQAWLDKMVRPCVRVATKMTC
jgi:hypothetical protein